MFENILYLSIGTTTQRKCYRILEQSKIMEVLKDMNPIVVGTIPININVENSDIDIVCEVQDYSNFKSLLVNSFSTYPQFKIKYNERFDAVVCNFFIDGFEIEIFGSTVESKLTNSYRHMVIEYRILELANESFREDIIRLKSEGLKTEPAFAKCLNLKGDPYQAILRYESYTNEEIRNELKECYYSR